jgi:hypothetical protein
MQQQQGGKPYFNMAVETGISYNYRLEHDRSDSNDKSAYIYDAP